MLRISDTEKINYLCIKEFDENFFIYSDVIANYGFLCVPSIVFASIFERVTAVGAGARDSVAEGVGLEVLDLALEMSYHLFIAYSLQGSPAGIHGQELLYFLNKPLFYHSIDPRIDHAIELFSFSRKADLDKVIGERSC